MTLKTTGEEDVLFLGMEENKTKKNHTFRLPHSLQFHFAAHSQQPKRLTRRLRWQITSALRRRGTKAISRLRDPSLVTFALLGLNA